MMTPCLFRIAFVGTLCTAVAPRLIAQEGGTLRGTITDSVTGTPLVGARVAVSCSGCYGRHPTDSMGRFRLNRLSPGRVRFEAHCPSATMLGAEITQQMIDIAPVGETILDVRVPPGLCDEPAYSERLGVFRGYWTPGFETSAFLPCADSALGMPAPLLPGKRLVSPTAWADLAVGVDSSVTWPRGAQVDSYGNATYFVVWRGVMKGPGTYGHMGVSAFSMVVDSVIAIRARGPADCGTR